MVATAEDNLRSNLLIASWSSSTIMGDGWVADAVMVVPMIESRCEQLRRARGTARHN